MIFRGNRRSPRARSLAGALRVALVAGGLFAGAVLRADQSVMIGPGIAFTPANIVVAPGETVTWTWLGAPHSTTSNATSGPEFWDSTIVFTVNTTFSHTFTTPGTWPYYCRVHSSPNGTTMNGVVQVVAASPTPTATPIAPTPTATPVAPTPTATPGLAAGASIPTLGPAGRAALVLAFAATAFLLLRRR